MTYRMNFGVFIPQGWKMELSSIADPVDKWAKAVEVAELAEQLGLDSLWVYDHVHNVPVPAHEAVFECWTTLMRVVSNPRAAGENHLDAGRHLGRAARLGYRCGLV